MKFTIFLFLILLVSPHLGLAAKKSNRGTSFEFSEANIKGRYNTSGEGLSVVEDEKLIDDLLKIRKDFKDRVKNNLRVQK